MSTSSSSVELNQPHPPTAEVVDDELMDEEYLDGGDPEEGEEEEEEGSFSGRFLLFNAVPSWMFSMVIHIIILLMAALFTLPKVERDRMRELIVGKPDEEVEEIVEFEEQEIEIQEMEMTEANIESPVMPSTEVPTEVTDVAVADEVEAAAVAVDLMDFGERTAPKNDLLAQVGAFSGSGVSGRGAAARTQLVKANGGSKGSEAAVARALKWLAIHQLPDGGWSFDHRMSPRCNGKCSHHGELATTRNGATAMALLPFLGAGNTHKEGDYQEVVARGLYYLMNTQKKEVKGGLPTGSWHEGGGSMYSHGLAAITMCEAYAMTNDRALGQSAQLGINFISYAQDPVGGGWRYSPRQPGDTSVVGWQLMALKSGGMGYLQVQPQTIRGAEAFLDSVQEDSGSRYGYTSPGGGTGTSAVGLLCRMYMGWKRENAALQRGVERFDKSGPSLSGNRANMYYNYYATQVMRHYEGEEWERWNQRMRDPLVALQSKEGHTEGSWHLVGDHGAERGGRLYCTSMATMILEVYYRHMPLYRKQAAEEEFPL